MAKRPKREVETSDYTSFVRRAVKALGERIGQGDAECLADLVSLQRELDGIIDEAVRKLRHEPISCSWADIGRIVGTTRQAAHARWGHVGGDRKVGGQPTHLR